MSKTQFFYSVLILWLGVLLGLKFWRLEMAPPGFFVDEASIGYNALSILHTLKDEHGSWLPVYFEAFGEYKNPLFIYSSVVFVGLLGPSVAAIRVTAVAWSFLGLLGYIKLAQVLTPKKNVWVWAGLAFVGSPWILVLSRVGFEVISSVIFIIGLYYCLWQWQQSNKSYYWYAYVCLAGASFYSYTSMRILALFLFILAAFLFRHQLKRKFLLSMMLFLGWLIPAGLWEWWHPGSLRARYEIVSVFSYHQGIEAVWIIFSNYFQHWSPQFLFFEGDGNLRHGLGIRGTLLVSHIPLIALGMYQLLKRETRRLRIWLLLLILVSALLSSLTIQSPHALRSVGMLVGLLIISLYGLIGSMSLKPALWRVLILGLLVFEVTWVHYYFYEQYPARAQAWFDQDTLMALQRARLAPPPYFLSSNLYPGTYATWFYLRSFAPSIYQQGLEETDTRLIDPSRFSALAGTYVFDFDSCQTLPVSFTQIANKLESNTFTCVYRYEN